MRSRPFTLQVLISFLILLATLYINIKKGDYLSAALRDVVILIYKKLCIDSYIR